MFFLFLIVLVFREICTVFLRWKVKVVGKKTKPKKILNTGVVPAAMTVESLISCIFPGLHHQQKIIFMFRFKQREVN